VTRHDRRKALRRPVLGNLRALHFAQGDHTLGEDSRRVADALEVVGDFPGRKGGDDEANLI